MGYGFSRQASLVSYSPYQLFYGCEPILPSSNRGKLAPIVDLDDPNVWAQCLHDCAKFFQRAMPMAMENLAIAQHCDTLRYARIRSGAYRPQRFLQGKNADQSSEQRRPSSGVADGRNVGLFHW